jgi:PEGA domain.
LGTYNYEDEGKDFGETVRIDIINEKVRKSEELNPSPEPEDTQDEKDENDGNIEYSSQGSYDGGNEPLGNSIVRLSIIGGVVVFVFIFAVVFLSQSDLIGGVKAENTETNNNDISQGVAQDEGQYAIILNADSNRTVSFYSIKDKTHLSLTVDNATILTDSKGGSINYSELKIGDVVVVSERDDTGNADKIRIPDDVWHKENITGVKVDTSAGTVEYSDVIYTYGDDTFFVEDGNSVYPGDISETDTVTLIGKNNALFVARLEKSHGHLVFKNLDKIENAVIKVDGEVAEIDKANSMLEVVEGGHKIVVSGTNIEDYAIDINIISNDTTVVDLNEADLIKKTDTGVIKLNVNQSDYTVILDGVPYLQSTTEIIAEKGKHKIEIVKPGYEKTGMDVKVEDKAAEVNIKLKELKVSEEKTEVSEGNVSVYSTPGWAKVYIDGEYIGIAPVMKKLSYGEHYIKAELEGYDEFRTHITVNSPDKAITAKFE